MGDTGLGIAGIITGFEQLAKKEDVESYAERMARSDLIGVAKAAKTARDKIDSREAQRLRDDRSLYTHEHNKIINEITNINKLVADSIVSSEVRTDADVDKISEMYLANMDEVRAKYSDNPDLLNVIGRNQEITINTFKMKKEGIKMYDDLSGTYNKLREIRDPMISGSYSAEETGLTDILTNIRTKKASTEAIGNEVLFEALDRINEDATKTLFIKRKLNALDVNSTEPGVQFIELGEDEPKYSGAKNLIKTVDELVQAGRIDDAYQMILGHDSKEDADGRSMSSLLDDVLTATNESLRVQTSARMTELKNIVSKAGGIDIIEKYGIGNKINALSTNKGDYLGEETEQMYTEALQGEMDTILTMLNVDDTETQGMDLFYDSIKQSVAGLSDEGKLWAVGGFIKQLDSRAWVWNTKGSNHMYKNRKGEEVKSGKWGQRGEMVFDAIEVANSRKKLADMVVLDKDGEEAGDVHEIQYFNAVGKLVEENFRMRPHKKEDNTADLGDLADMARRNTLSKHADSLAQVGNTVEQNDAILSELISKGELTQADIEDIDKLLHNKKFRESWGYELPGGE